MVEKRPKPDWGDRKPYRRSGIKAMKSDPSKRVVHEEDIKSAVESLKQIAERELSRPPSEDEPDNGPPALWQSLTRAQREILAAYCVTGKISEAIKITGYSPWIHVNARERSKPYRKVYAIAKRVVGDVMESEVTRRAIEGVRRYKFHQGKPILDPDTGKPYYELEYSDQLALALLKAHKPSEYKERHQTEHKFTDQPQQGVSIVDIIKSRQQLLLTGTTANPESGNGNGDGHREGNGNGDDG